MDLRTRGLRELAVGIGVAVVVLAPSPLRALQGAYQTSDRTPRFEILKGNPNIQNLVEFIAQDLSVVRTANAPLAPYGGQVLARYSAAHAGGTPPNDLELATAIVDYVAGFMRHPAMYPEDPSLPRMYPPQPNPAYYGLQYDPARILDFTAQYDPVDAANWPSPFCDLQNAAAAGLLNYFGLHARSVNVEEHVGLEYFSWMAGKWVWMDASFNEHYISTATGSPLGAKELNALTLAGALTSVAPVKHGYPTDRYAANSYLGWADRPGLHPHGFRQYAVANYMRLANGGGNAKSRFNTWVYSPSVPSSYQTLPGEVLNFERDPAWGWFYWPIISDASALDYPLDTTELRPGFGLVMDDAGTPHFSFSVKTYLPYTARFELLSDAQPVWTTVQQITTPSTRPAVSREITVPFGVGIVRVRAVDTLNNCSQPVMIRLN